MRGYPNTIATRQDVAVLLAVPEYHDRVVSHLQALLDERHGWQSQGAIALDAVIEPAAGRRVRTDYDAVGRATTRQVDQWGAGQSWGLDRLGLTVAEAVAMGAEDRAVAAPADDMEAVRYTARAMIDDWTNARMFGVFTDSQGHVYKVNKTVRDWMTGLEAKLAGGMVLPDGWTWDDAEGNAIAHTVETFRTLTTEIALWTDALYRTCTRAQAAVDAAGDAVAVDAVLVGIAWPAGTPA